MADTKRYQRHDADTGSPEYQVWKLWEKIKVLQLHVKDNPQDFSAKRSLLRLVAKRRQHLKYLKSQDLDRYLVVSKKVKVKV